MHATPHPIVLNFFPMSKYSVLLLVASGLLVPAACAQTPATQAAVAVAAKASAQSKAPTIPFRVASVNPFVGTAEHGHTYPGATTPFGMTQVSPDTTTLGWDGASGYYYADSVIRGFSFTHLSGVGRAGGLGDFMLMPTVGEVQLVAGDPGKTPGYASKFSHDNEAATPGYYKVLLDDSRVTAELTAATRCGMQRYTFPASDSSHVVLDLEHGIGSTVAESGLTIENATTLSGYRLSDGWGGRRAAYFVMEFSRPFDSYGIEKDGARLVGLPVKTDGKAVKFFANYKTSANEQITVRVGVSSTSIEGARKNLAAEMPNFDFNAVHGKAVNAWNDVLGQIEVQSRDPKIVRTFYSNLYQSSLGPVLFNDVDGAYRGADGQNHAGDGFQNYTTFSLWDTFRAQHPLLTITQPQRIADIVNTLVAFEKERGKDEMPVWTLWGNETNTMIGYNSAPVVVDAYLKGFKGFDAEAAYQALRRTALNERNGQGDFNKVGYAVSGVTGESVSRSLEYAFDDWCIAQMAQKLGHKEDAKMFFARAANFTNLFDSSTGFMRGRKASGAWSRPFDPKVGTGDFTQANPWQNTWAVMQDPQKLVSMMGGDTAFINKLDGLFNEGGEKSNYIGATGLIGQYAHGNEPVHHVAYLFNYAGAPYKTQFRVRQVMSSFYSDTAAGSPGNNDVGQMSAWYIFSALGFYPVNPAQGVYVLGSPAVDKATIHLDKKLYGGKTFTVIAQNNSPQNVYIQSATLDGQPLTQSFITHQQLTKGGTLNFVMGPNPNVNWGKAVASRPPSGMPANYPYSALPEGSKPVNVNWKLPIRVAPGLEEETQGWLPDFTVDAGSFNTKDVAVNTNVPNAAPEKIYQTERYGSDITYKYPVPKGATYTVRLHFAEIFSPKAGDRLENISINGKVVLPKLDIAAEAGNNKALVKEFTDVAPDANGNIVIRVQADPSSKDQNSKISAIEILKP